MLFYLFNFLIVHPKIKEDTNSHENFLLTFKYISLSPHWKKIAGYLLIEREKFAGK